MFFPIAITFTSDDYEHTPDSFDTIIDRCIRDSIADYNEKNKGINIEYKLCSTDFQDTDCQSVLQQELSKYSWWKLRNYKPQAMGLTFIPVFVFDQFEEVFNLPGSIVWTKKFFDWLEDVSSNSCPDEIVNKVREIIGTNATFPTIKEEKDFKAVFSLRKEFIGELDYWGMQKCFIPSLKDNRYCLKALTYEGAMKVMTQQQRFEETKVKQVLDYFVQQYSREPEKTTQENLPVIPALLLSIVCDSWEKDIHFFSDIDANGIDESLNKILEKFYDEALSTIVVESSQQETNNQADSIRNDIETAIFALVDSNGKRVRRKSSELSHLDFDAIYKELLSNKHIIKISKVDGEDYVEIVHDALCSIIAKRKEKYLAAEAKKLEEEKLRELTKKNRKRMIVATVIGLSIIGILLFFLWQNNRFLKEQKARNLSEAEKDSIAQLNISLKQQIQINEKQNDSIKLLNKSLFAQMEVVKIQKDSLKICLETLQDQIHINKQQEELLKAKNNLDIIENASFVTPTSETITEVLKYVDLFRLFLCKKDIPSINEIINENATIIEQIIDKNNKRKTSVMGKNRYLYQLSNMFNINEYINIRFDSIKDEASNTDYAITVEQSTLNSNTFKIRLLETQILASKTEPTNYILQLIMNIANGKALIFKISKQQSIDSSTSTDEIFQLYDFYIP